MRGLAAVWLGTMLVQSCVMPEPRFTIISVAPKHVPRSYFRDSPELWRNVADVWKLDGNYLGFEVVTSARVPIENSNYDQGVIPVALIVEDCSEHIRQVFHPGTRYIGEAASGEFKYETVIEYKRTENSINRLNYNLFKEPTELCFSIVTVEMPFYQHGHRYHLMLNDRIRQIAEGS